MGLKMKLLKTFSIFSKGIRSTEGSSSCSGWIGSSKVCGHLNNNFISNNCNSNTRIDSGRELLREHVDLATQASPVARERLDLQQQLRRGRPKELLRLRFAQRRRRPQFRISKFVLTVDPVHRGVVCQWVCHRVYGRFACLISRTCDTKTKLKKHCRIYQVRNSDLKYKEWFTFNLSLHFINWDIFVVHAFGIVEINWIELNWIECHLCSLASGTRVYLFFLEVRKQKKAGNRWLKVHKLKMGTQVMVTGCHWAI